MSRGEPPSGGVTRRRAGALRAGGGEPAITNIALLLALRDLGRVDPAVSVPPFLVIDSPLNGLGAQGIDRETGRRLIDTLVSIAEDPAADGYGCQIVAATNDPLTHDYPAVREIHLSDTHRFFGHAPRHDT